VDKLVTISVNRLTEKDSPSLETLKMQVAFDQSYVESQKVVDGHANDLEEHAEELMVEIVDSKARGAQASEALYRKIISFVIVRIGLGNSTDPLVVRETAAALESVFPHAELRTFVSMPEQQKRTQLAELAAIIMGILLFNKETARGGAGLVDEHGGAVQLSAELRAEIQESLEVLRTRIGEYMLVINYMHMHGVTLQNPIRRYQDEVANRRQLASYLQSIADEIDGARARLSDARHRFTTEMSSLKGVVSLQAAVPTEQVYPRFVTLASLYEVYREEKSQLQARRSMLDTLAAFSASFVPVLRDVDVHAASTTLPGRQDHSQIAFGSESAPQNEDDDMVGTSGEMGMSLPTGAQLVTRGNTEGFMELPVELRGFCPVTMVQREALLMPGNLSLGLVAYQGKYYALANKQAISLFMQDPGSILAALLTLVKQSPELIHLLGLQSMFPNSSLPRLDHYPGYSASGMLPGLFLAPTSDAGTQTPTHFMEDNIDKSYFWNEWEMRRWAVKLSNIVFHRKTKSSQTVASHFRRENESQVWLPKAATSQVGVHAGTNVAKKANYIKGLRGAPAPAMKVVKLEIDV
jgi:hypothetical protein